MTVQDEVSIESGDHKSYMEHAAMIATQASQDPARYCVGAVLVDGDTGNILSTGYSGELPGDMPGDGGTTHAEQCCFIKIAQKHGRPIACPELHIKDVLPPNTVLYTTMEPCNARLTGNRTCCTRIVALKDVLRIVYVGTREPGVFIRDNDGKQRLEAEGIAFEMVPEAHDLCYNVAMVAHSR